MKSLNFMKSRMILSCLMYVILGLVLVIYPDTIASMIAYIFAILVLLVGIIMVAFYAKDEVILMASKKTLSIGLILICAAVYCLINISFLISIIPTVLGLVAVLNGFGKLQNAFDLFRTHNSGGGIILIMALLIVAFGILLLINPFGATNTFYRLIGIALLFGGITDIISYVVMSKKLQEAIEDAQAIDVTDASSHTK